MSWRPLLISTEIQANLRCRLVRHLLTVLALTGLLWSVAAVEATNVDRSLLLQRQNVAAGSNVWVVEPTLAALEPTLPADRCEQVASLPQVIAAGGIVKLEAVTFDRAPGTPFRYFQGTGGIGQVFDPSFDQATVSPPRIILGPATATQLGVRSGHTVTFSGRRLAAAPLSGPVRLPSGDAVVIEERSLDLVDQCWIELAPGADPDLGLVPVSELFNEADVDATIQPLLGKVVDPVELYESSPGRWLWLVVVGLLVLVGVMQAITTRDERAIYQTLGSGRVPAVLIAVGETVVVLAWASAAAMTIIAISNHETEAALRAILVVMAAFGCSIPIIVAVEVRLASRSIGAQLKE